MTGYTDLSPDIQALMKGIESSKADTPVADALRKKNREEEAARRAKEAETFRTAKPGQVIKGHGIFVGIFKPADRDGNSLGLAFNVVAAPEDLSSEALTYNATVEKLAGLEDWHGYDGSGYRNEDEMIAALKDQSYKGEWIIPPREALYGRRAAAGQIRNSGEDKNNQVQPDNLRAHRDKKEFKGTYHESGAYWSSAMMSLGNLVWNIRMTSGIESYDNPRTNAGRCRPVRLIPVAEA